MTSSSLDDTMSASSSAIHTAKQALRKQVRAKLSAIDDRSLSAQSAAVTRKVLAHPVYQRAKRISVYVSMPTSELRTDAIIHHALANNKKLFIPYLPPVKGSRMQLLRLRDVQEFEALKPDKWKIRSLAEEGILERENALDEATGSGLDLILMPGLAFDRQLNRLGHGRGYYDTYLSQCAQYSQKHGLPSPYTIALALNEQILEEKDGRIPTIDIEDGHSSAHKDVKPDELIFPDGEVSSH